MENGELVNLQNSSDGDDVTELHTQLHLVLHRYEGETCGGLRHGEGVASYEGGHTYKGMFSRGLMEGPGVFTWSNGFRYEGEFVCNTPMGQGTYTWPDGSSYTGDVCNGLRHGSGTYTCAGSGVSYRGQWVQGRRHGEGTVYYDQNRTSWYRGDWVRNSREGWGVRCYASGNMYCGEWKKNRRHGQGTMRWLQLGQQYAGEWVEGLQHGRGTHVWTLQRPNGYSQNIQYTGEFVQGQRQGQGVFSYGGGAEYAGEWRNNKKHGRGRFTFEDGRVFEGEFVDDQMMTPSVNTGPAANPQCDDSSAPHIGLNIESLLHKIPERKRNSELKQVECVVLWKNTQLRSIYSFYSSLGQTHNSLLSHLQLWRLLRDCKLHHHGMSLAQMDRWTKEDEATEIHSPFTAMLLPRFISCLVIVAFHIYSREMASTENLLAACLSKLLTDDILPNAKKVTGSLFRQTHPSVPSSTYIQRSWKIYESFCRANGGATMTCRHLLWMFKDLQLLDSNLTAATLLGIINAEGPDANNLSSCLDYEMIFLEFFEVLLSCAEVKGRQVPEDQEEGGETTGRLLKISAPANSPDVQRPDSAETDGCVCADTAECSQTHPPLSDVSEEHINKNIQSRGAKTHQDGPEVWTQTTQQFFKHVFFPAFEHYESVNRYLKKVKSISPVSGHKNQSSAGSPIYST